MSQENGKSGRGRRFFASIRQCMMRAVGKAVAKVESLEQRQMLSGTVTQLEAQWFDTNESTGVTVMNEGAIALVEAQALPAYASQPYEVQAVGGTGEAEPTWNDTLPSVVDDNTEFVIDWGDNSTSSSFSEPGDFRFAMYHGQQFVTAFHNYATAGEYEATLTIVEDSTVSASIPFVLTVDGQSNRNTQKNTEEQEGNLVPDLEASTTQIVPTEWASIYASDATASEPQYNCMSFWVDWDDNTWNMYVENGPLCAWSESEWESGGCFSGTHEYDDAGSYTAVMTADYFDTTEFDIEVSPPLHAVNSSVDAISGYTTVNLAGIDDSYTYACWYQFAWGDGTCNSSGDATVWMSEDTIYGNHVYAEAGTYVAWLYVCQTNTSTLECISFTVTVIDDALPTLDGINDQLTFKDAAQQTVSLSGISAGGSESQTLWITATSDNTDLIDTPAISYTSPYGCGTLSFVSTSGATGWATITVTVHDDAGNGLSAECTQTFIVCVDEPPPPMSGTTEGSLAWTDSGALRYSDGAVKVNTGGGTMLLSSVPPPQFSFLGNNLMPSWAWLEDYSGPIAVHPDGGADAVVFDWTGSGYEPRGLGFQNMQLAAESGGFVLTEGNGTQIHFFGFGGSEALAGQFKSSTDPHGTTAVAVTAGDKIVRIDRCDAGSNLLESVCYTYLTTGENTGRMAGVSLSRGAGVASRMQFEYYGSSENYGSVGDLKSVTSEDATCQALGTSYYRYDSGTGALKFVFDATAYARLLADHGDPASLSDLCVAPYATQGFEIDGSGRVETVNIQGQGAYTYTYSEVSSFCDGYNSWQHKTVESLPSGAQNIVYSNYLGEVMLKIFQDSGGHRWGTFYKYADSCMSAGHLLMSAEPSAFTAGFQSVCLSTLEGYGDLLHWDGDDYEYLSDYGGLVHFTSYYGSTTAGENTAGAVDGCQACQWIQHGELGTAIPQSYTQYFAHTYGLTIYPVATQTVYRNTDGSGGETTCYCYTWDGLRMLSRTVSEPIVTTAQNGPNTADSQDTYYDALGRVQWTRDAGGFINYTAHDDVTGAVIKTIRDVNTACTSSFVNLPAGWSTPSGGGLHLVTEMEIDAKGRTTKLTDPNGDVAYTVYNDLNHEVRTYRGWNSSTHLPTGPISVSRYDMAGGYSESLTFSATPTLDENDEPDGGETIACLRSLSRTFTNADGQVTCSDSYFDLYGLSYTTAAMGSGNVNFYRTRYGYDSAGRQDGTLSPTGTITRTVYDDLDRAIQTWIGTDDTPTSGEWSPINTSGTNLVKVSSNEYDMGGVGDGNLTSTIQYPNDGSANRVTLNWYDWRDRLIATKGGALLDGNGDPDPSGENDGTHRTITYFGLDNLSERTETYLYAGDGVSLTAITEQGGSDTDGVPNAPASGMQAKSTAEYDNQRRVFATHVFSVVSGTPGACQTWQNWFDRRGNKIKSVGPDGLVSKFAFDGAGRQTVTFSTDGGGDSGWGDADDVSGDIVLAQQETVLDANGNAIFTIDRERFDDAVCTGALGNPGSTGSTAKARVYYTERFYDSLNRLVGSVNLGTWGGTVLTDRPDSITPSRSDTRLVSSVVYDQYDGFGRPMVDQTDPNEIVTRTVTDALGRKVQQFEDYFYAGSGHLNRLTSWTYDANGNILTMKALDTGYQETGYGYGVTTAGGSYVNSNDILATVKYPRKTAGGGQSAGDASNLSSEQQSFSYNALGQPISMSDPNGNTHGYTYDVLGRQIADNVGTGTLNGGVDGAVRKLGVSYDLAGRVCTGSSYDVSNCIVNQVLYEYNGFGQMTAEYQEHGGAVCTITSASVQYAYDSTTGRLVSMSYPNGRILHLGYDSGIDASISRLSFLADDDGSGGVGQHLEDYTYLGLSTVVKRAHAESGIDLSYIKLSGNDGDAGDKYTGLGRFGQVIDQRWMNGSGTAADRFQYAYDRNGNPLSKTNCLCASYSETYGYDNIGRLIDTNRNGSDLQSWTLDALGNWDSFTNGGTTQTQTQNAQNQITCISGQTTPTYDNNGSMTGDEVGTTYVYDAWGRLVKANKSGTCESFAYDAAGRRISESLSGTTTDFYFSAQWQVIEERISGTTKVQYVWSPVYVDAVVLRDADTTAGGNLGKSGSGLDQRLYVAQDAFWNVTALVSAGGAVVERFVYDPYGSVAVLNADGTARTGGTCYSWKYLHQGGRLDGFTGLYLFRHRDYSPSLGTWTEQDPAGYVDGANLYLARLGSPIGNLDATGLYQCHGYEYQDGMPQEDENIIGEYDEDGVPNGYDQEEDLEMLETGSAGAKMFIAKQLTLDRVLPPTALTIDNPDPEDVLGAVGQAVTDVLKDVGLGILEKIANSNIGELLPTKNEDTIFGYHAAGAVTFRYKWAANCLFFFGCTIIDETRFSWHDATITVSATSDKHNAGIPSRVNAIGQAMDGLVFNARQLAIKRLDYMDWVPDDYEQ